MVIKLPGYLTILPLTNRMLASVRRRAAWSLQYASNLRAWNNGTAAIFSVRPGAAPYLALLGNCLSTRTAEAEEESAKFLQYCSKEWDRIFIVPGPEELVCESGSTPYWQRADCLAALAEEVGNASIMNQNEVFFERENIVLLGASLWSDCYAMSDEVLPSGSPESRIYKTKGNPIQVDDIRDWSRDDFDWLQGAICEWSNASPTTDIVICSHTLSSIYLMDRVKSLTGVSGPELERLPLDLPSSSALEAVHDAGTLTAWLSGAGGSCASGLFAGVFCASNARWKGPALHPNFMPDRRLELREMAPPLVSVSPTLSPQMC